MDVYPCHRQRFDLQISDDEGEHAVKIPVEVHFEWNHYELTWSLQYFRSGLDWLKPENHPEMEKVLTKCLGRKLNDAELQTILDDHPEYV